MFILFHFVISILVGFIDVILGLGFLLFLYGFALFIPGIAVGVRRLHDTGRSGWWLLIGTFVPLLGPILMLVFFCEDSKLGENQYGQSHQDISSYGGVSA